MGFFASITSATDALESKWLGELSRSSDLNAVLPLVYFEAQAIADYQHRLNKFTQNNGVSGLGVMQYLNLRLESAVTEAVNGRSDGLKNFSAIVSVLDDSDFLCVNEGGASEPRISVSIGHQFNEFVKDMTIADAEVLVLDEPAIHHWKRSLEGALVILREFCPDAINGLAGRHLKIIPVVSPKRNLSLSASNEFVSATITASWVTPKECAEMLLHEMGHSLLADILSVTELSHEIEADLYYSPFRDDARPIDGLIHAAYSFHNVCIYKSVIATGASGSLSNWAVRTVYSDFLRTLVCVRILLQSSVLTEKGYELVQTIERDVREIASQLDIKKDAKVVSMLRMHFSDWRANNLNIASSSIDLFARIIEEVIGECTHADLRHGSTSATKYNEAEQTSSSERSVEFDSIAEFWHSGFPSRVSVLRGAAPPIEQSIASDIAIHKALLVPVIESESYKGKTTDPRRLSTLGEAFHRTSNRFFLVLRNFERISSSVCELEEFISGRNFAIGATEHDLFCNYAGLTVPLHTDSANNLHFVITGKKTFFIADAKTTVKSSTEARYQEGFSSFKPFENTDTAKEMGEFVTLNAGDVVFIPPERWHAVHYHEPSISVSIFDEIFSSLAVAKVV